MEPRTSKEFLDALSDGAPGGGRQWGEEGYVETRQIVGFETRAGMKKVGPTLVMVWFLAGCALILAHRATVRKA